MDEMTETAKEPEEESILSQVQFRMVSPTDIPVCHAIEHASYPVDEAASKSRLQYRQHHAARYFRCAVLANHDNDDDGVEANQTDSYTIIGFICSTRCRELTHDSLFTHDSSGPLLAIHSVVVSPEYRKQGIARAMMKDYLQAIRDMNDGVETIALMAKADLLGFYVQCGFQVVGVSDIVHGQDVWYDCRSSLKKETIGYPCWIVDSFAVTGGSGNPAAVVLLPSPVKEDWMKMVAQEFNLSETAFIWPKRMSNDDDPNMIAQGKQTEVDDDDAETLEEVVNYFIRYYTCSGTEVNLCGHATLASAAVLFQRLPFKNAKSAAIAFEAKEDVLKVTPYLDLFKSWTQNQLSMQFQMDFPLKRLKEITAPADRLAVCEMLLSAFSLQDVNVAESILFMGLDQDGNDVLIELTAKLFYSLSHDNVQYSALMEWNGYSRGVIVCCLEDEPTYDEDEGELPENDTTAHVTVDFLSRFFGPKAGINEDPVTGSSHCTLGPYFASQLSKTTVVGKQMSVRGGTVTCVVDESNDRVRIIGQAITVMSGSLKI